MYLEHILHPVYTTLLDVYRKQANVSTITLQKQSFSEMISTDLNCEYHRETPNQAMYHRGTQNVTTK